MAATSTIVTEPDQKTEWETVHRVVFPTDSDPAVLPLYIDWGLMPSSMGLTRDEDYHSQTKSIIETALKKNLGTTEFKKPRLLSFDRRSATIPAGERLSFATYFNAFPAAYWHQWTDVATVRLSLTVSNGATVDVFRSNAVGTYHRIDGALDADGPLVFDLSLDKFGDGGWLWFDVVAGAEPATVAGAEWSVAASTRRQDGTKLSVAITTLNRPDDCVTQMKRFLSAPSLLERLDQLIITDQGTKPVKEAAGYAATAKSLGSRFRLVEQANLGGSGGFARGMDEGTRNRDSAYVMLLDDDVLVEPESILRAINFADYTRRPTLVGGHMLNLYQRSQIHNLGERVDTYSFTYGPTEGRLDTLDFARHPLRATPLLHERQDVDYNAWWMCLIPRETIEEIGLALPVFIKWDDVEYGLRAKQHGFTTVSLPGVGVWHMPFTQKDDRLDWQAYFHQRNRWISALLYSPYPHGGAVPKQSFATDVKHLVSMQYSSAALRITALEDVLKGPEFLQASIATRLGEIRALQKRFSDSRVIKRVADYPPVQRLRPLQKGTEPGAPQNRYQFLRMALSAALRQFHGADGQSREFPEERVTAFDARWWRLAHYDSALVSSSDGAGAAVYRRDSRAFRAMLRRSAQLHLELMRRWDELKTQYRAALPEITSPEEWRKTFEHSDE